MQRKAFSEIDGLIYIPIYIYIYIYILIYILIYICISKLFGYCVLSFIKMFVHWCYIELLHSTVLICFVS